MQPPPHFVVALALLWRPPQCHTHCIDRTRVSALTRHAHHAVSAYCVQRLVGSATFRGDPAFASARGSASGAARLHNWSNAISPACGLTLTAMRLRACASREPTTASAEKSWYTTAFAIRILSRSCCAASSAAVTIGT